MRKHSSSDGGATFTVLTAVLTFLLAVGLAFTAADAEGQVFGGAARKVQTRATAPSNCSTGDVYIDSTVQRIFVCFSGSWRLSGAAVYTSPVTAPPTSGWTLYKDATATASATPDTTYGFPRFSWTHPGGAVERIVLWTRNKPTPPYTITVAWQDSSYRTSTNTSMNIRYGIGFYNTANTRMLAQTIHENAMAASSAAYDITRTTGLTSMGGSVTTWTGIVQMFRPIKYMRMTDDGTNLKFFISQDGYYWSPAMHSETYATHVLSTYDKIALVMSSYNAEADALLGVNLYSWKQE
jgi:hypothetical protein